MKEELGKNSASRLTEVLRHLDIAKSSWYREAVPAEERKKPGPKPIELPSDLLTFVEVMALTHDRWGYQKLAVICRRYRYVSDRNVYKTLKNAGLLKKRIRRKQEIIESQKLYELLPQGPNQLWQMDVTYIYIKTYGWFYAITVIDYYSRYLLACYFTRSYSAKEAVKALQQARDEAFKIHGKLDAVPFLVTDNGSCFIARHFEEALAEKFAHVRIRYRTPQQLGLLERFHETLKQEEVYYKEYETPWEAMNSLEQYRNLYNKIRPHWALKPIEGGDVLTPRDVYIHGKTIQIPKWQAWAKGAKEKLEKMLKENAA